MTVIHKYKLKRPCGNIRPFCRTCTNTFAIDNCGPSGCASAPPGVVCVNQYLPGCLHPEIPSIPKGFVLMIYLNGGFEGNTDTYHFGLTLGPFISEESIIGQENSFYESCGSTIIPNNFPGVAGYPGNVGCGYRINTNWPVFGPPPDYSWSS